MSEIKTIREELGLSQRKLANILGINKGLLHLAEQGKRKLPLYALDTLHVLVKISRNMKFTEKFPGPKYFIGLLEKEMSYLKEISETLARVSETRSAAKRSVKYTKSLLKQKDLSVTARQRWLESKAQDQEILSKNPFSMILKLRIEKLVSREKIKVLKHIMSRSGKSRKRKKDPGGREQE